MPRLRARLLRRSAPPPTRLLSPSPPLFLCFSLRHCPPSPVYQAAAKERAAANEAAAKERAAANEAAAKERAAAKEKAAEARAAAEKEKAAAAAQKAAEKPAPAPKAEKPAPAPAAEAPKPAAAPVVAPADGMLSTNEANNILANYKASKAK